jgi:Tfp pilus assembly protein PilW
MTTRIKRYRTRRGTVLIEMLVSSLVALLIGAAVLACVQVTAQTNATILGQNNTDSVARRPLDILADNLRNAQVYGTTGASCIQAATTSSLSCYTDSAGSYVRFWQDSTTTPATFKKTSGATTTILITGVTSLIFTYYTSTGLYSPASSSWATTVDPNNPTATELTKVAAIGIKATVTVNGYTRTLSSVVRLRNSPPNVN